jgi:hypothetical protein
LKKLGFETVAHVPVLFDSNSRYCREFNRYLRERATLEWVPKGTKKAVLPLAAGEGNTLVATGAKLAKGAKAVASINLASKGTVSVRFSVK